MSISFNLSSIFSCCCQTTVESINSVDNSLQHGHSSQSSIGRRSLAIIQNQASKLFIPPNQPVSPLSQIHSHSQSESSYSQSVSNCTNQITYSPKRPVMELRRQDYFESESQSFMPPLPPSLSNYSEEELEERNLLHTMIRDISKGRYGNVYPIQTNDPEQKIFRVETFENGLKITRHIDYTNRCFVNPEELSEGKEEHV